MLHTALLWHMHQPYYVNPLTKTAMMPWVRLHAVKGYLDMIEMARRHPQVRMVFNMTPVLVRQIVELASGETRDLWQKWSLIPAAELDPAQKSLLLEHFFKANWDNLIRPHARYHQLLTKRGYDIGHLSLGGIAESFTRQEFLDLQVWFNLAWCGYAACAEFPELRELKAKGRNFSEEDKRVVLRIHQQILEGLLPRYRRLAESGSIEISTSPFFHPIAPLLIDSECAHRAEPMASLPARFRWPQDAEAQLRLAAEQHQEVFGSPPAGLWPSEGSVCPELIPMAQKLGYRWMATDEDILFRSLARESSHPTERLRLYDPHRAEWNGAAMELVFRDRTLSDFIGFSASRNAPADAAAHIMRHLRDIADATRSQEAPILAIILDGENAWEFFPDGGESFLDHWYHDLARHDGWRTTTLAEYASLPVQRRTLSQLHTGSWIHANFNIWIGSLEDNSAWNLLGETRLWWEQRRAKTDPELARRVDMEIYAAEGSDWFWWYGPEFSTDNKPLFDELFRTHLQNVYRLCGATPPEALARPVLRTLQAAPAQGPALDFIHPVIDGVVTTFFEWHEAAFHEPIQGAMCRGESAVKRLHHGSDLENWYLRLDPEPNVLKHRHLLIQVSVQNGPTFLYDWHPATGLITARAEATETRCAFRKIVEIAIPLRLFCGDPCHPVNFQVATLNAEMDPPVVMETIPEGHWIPFHPPNATFSEENWSV